MYELGIGPTENPSFEVNSALLSRAAVYVLQPLSEQDLKQIVALAQAEQALPAIEDVAIDRLVAYADGDARRLLNTLETLAMAATQEKLAEITDEWLLKVLGERMRRYDKGGEQFYVIRNVNRVSTSRHFLFFCLFFRLIRNEERVHWASPLSTATRS